MKFKSLIVLSSAALLAGCFGDDSVTSVNEEAKDKANISLKFIDSNTGDPIDSVSVYSSNAKKTAISDTLGIVVWKSNTIGDYDYEVTKDGYATVRTTVTLSENGQGSVARVPDQFKSIKLHKQGVSVNGTVLVKNAETGNLSAAEKVPVVLKFEDKNIYPAEVETTTNSSGVFEFEDLPENTGYYILVPQAEIKGQTYEMANKNVSVGSLRAGEKKSLDQITMELIGLKPEMISSNKQTMKDTASLQLKFSTQLVADSVPNAWKVYKNGSVQQSCDEVCVAWDDWGDCIDYEDVCSPVVTGGVLVLTTAKLSDDKKTVVITPVSETWTNKGSYYVTGHVYSTEGRPADYNTYFTPGGAAAQPDNIAKWYDQDNTGSYLQMSWKAVSEDIKGYKVFYKTSKMADYEYFRTLDKDANDYEFYYGDLPDEVTRVYFKILPYITINGEDITADPAEAKEITFKL